MWFAFEWEHFCKNKSKLSKIFFPAYNSGFSSTLFFTTADIPKALCFSLTLYLQEKSLIYVTCVVLREAPDMPSPNTDANTQVSTDSHTLNSCWKLVLSHKLIPTCSCLHHVRRCLTPRSEQPCSLGNRLPSLGRTHTLTHRRISVTCCCQW